MQSIVIGIKKRNFLYTHVFNFKLTQTGNSKVQGLVSAHIRASQTMGRDPQVGCGTLPHGSRESFCKTIITVITNDSLPPNYNAVLLFPAPTSNFLQNKTLLVISEIPASCC